MWQHATTKQLYASVDSQESPSGKVRVQSATTGRWYWIPRSKLLDLGPDLSEVEASLAADARAARKEHLEHLAWLLSRELPYNLGTAVTHIALSEWDGSLLTARAAIRDEEERLRQSTNATTEQGD